MPRRLSIAGLALGSTLLAITPALAGAAADEAAPLPAWEQTLYKTLTYQAASNLSDLALYGLLLGGTAVGGVGFVAVNVTSAMALYYAHDYAWQTLGPPPEDKTHQTVAEKTLGYRALATVKNFALGYAFGGTAVAAGGFVVAGAIADTAIFVGNEYAWDAQRPAAAVP